MKINFIANFGNGYVGEQADQVHLAREMRSLGHTVQEVPQDIWKAICDGEWNNDWIGRTPLKDADINIITKWHHFDHAKYINDLRNWSHAPVFYWVWDFIYYGGMPSWHMQMVTHADLYLGNDVRDYHYAHLKNAYYFPFDIADGEIAREQSKNKKYNVTFFGSCIGQGDRIEWLKRINETHHITFFSWNYEEWKQAGLEAYPAVYGNEFAQKVAESKIILGLSVEPHVWGYWSNRVGKILSLGGFLLYQYAPGMEIFLEDGCDYFSSVQEANEKISYYLTNPDKRDEVSHRGLEIGRSHFTSNSRVKDLLILCERYLKEKNGELWTI